MQLYHELCAQPMPKKDTMIPRAKRAIRIILVALFPLGLLKLAACSSPVPVEPLRPSSYEGTQSPEPLAVSLAGLDQFNRDVRPLTGSCGSHEAELRYSEQAREGIIVALRSKFPALVVTDGSLPSLAVAVRGVRIWFRCFDAICRSSARVDLAAELVRSGGSRSTYAAAGQDDASHPNSVFLCGGGSAAIGESVRGALEKALAELVPQTKL